MNDDEMARPSQVGLVGMENLNLTLITDNDDMIVIPEFSR